ncbi:hypothetical protein SUGI_0343850 [Cryptomeria japonica]|nr:hypothetical protein SUGI_0343850 [Cryptomeria japonica]
MESYTGVIPYVYWRFMRGRHSGYHRLGKERGGRSRNRGLRKIQIRGSNRISWAVRSPLRVKLWPPICLLKSVKETYNVMFSLASKQNPTSSGVQDGASRSVCHGPVLFKLKVAGRN